MSVDSIPSHWPVQSDWTPRLESHFESDSFQGLCQFVQQERDLGVVYPPPENVFSAFRLTSFDATRVVILGQDPYHGLGQAHGLSFSVAGKNKIPPSLRNILKERSEDLKLPPRVNGDLTDWARQGVFLLNTVLTVRDADANSHRKRGWEEFTDEVIRQLNDHDNGIVFLLWGKPAETKRDLIDERHHVIASPHPSPLSAYRGFFGSRPFSQANEALVSMGRPEVNW